MEDLRSIRKVIYLLLVLLVGNFAILAVMVGVYNMLTITILATTAIAIFGFTFVSLALVRVVKELEEKNIKNK